MGHEFAGEGVFALEGLGDCPVGAEAHLAEGYFEGGGRAGVEGLEGGAGPCWDVCCAWGGGGGGGGLLGGFVFEGGDDGFDGVVLEGAVYGAAEGAGEKDGFIGR